MKKVVFIFSILFQFSLLQLMIYFTQWLPYYGEERIASIVITTVAVVIFNLFCYICYEKFSKKERVAYISLLSIQVLTFAFLFANSIAHRYDTIIDPMLIDEPISFITFFFHTYTYSLEQVYGILSIYNSIYVLFAVYILPALYLGRYILYKYHHNIYTGK